MATIKDIRSENLQTLKKELGTLVALANAANTSPAYLGQILNGTRGLGDALARKLEAHCRKPTGWMDRPHNVEQNNFSVRAIHPDDPLPDDVVQVPESRIEFSAGNGRVANYESVEDSEPAIYRRAWLRKYGLNPERLRRFPVHGDSQEPTLFHGDTVLVNLDETNIVDGKLYAIRYDDELRIKYLFRKLDGTLILRSQNPAYPDEEVSSELANEHISIIGRVRDKSGPGGL